MIADELRIDTAWAGVTPGRTPLQIDSISLLPDGRARLQGTGDPGYLAVEASSDLVNWQELASFLSVNGAFEFTDSVDNANPRFYRTRRDY